MVSVEGNTWRAEMVRSVRAPRCRRSSCTYVKPNIGTWESFTLHLGSRTGVAEGRRQSEMKMYEVKQSDGVIVPLKAANKGAEAPAELLEGKDVNQRESARPKHRPDSGPGNCVPGGGADTAGCEEESEGEIYSVTAPYNARHATLGILLAKGWEGGGGWTELRGKSTRKGWKSGCLT